MREGISGKFIGISFLLRNVALAYGPANAATSAVPRIGLQRCPIAEVAPVAVDLFGSHAVPSVLMRTSNPEGELGKPAPSGGNCDIRICANHASTSRDVGLGGRGNLRIGASRTCLASCRFPFRKILVHPDKQAILSLAGDSIHSA